MISGLHSVFLDGILDKHNVADLQHQRDCANMLIQFLKSISLVSNKEIRKKILLSTVISKLNLLGKLVQTAGDYQLQASALEIVVRIALRFKSNRDKIIKRFCFGLANSEKQRKGMKMFGTFLAK